MREIREEIIYSDDLRALSILVDKGQQTHITIKGCRDFYYFYYLDENSIIEMLYSLFWINDCIQEAQRNDIAQINVNNN